MKVCFIWVEKFRNFENLAFNISSSTKFYYDPNKNKLTKKNIESLPKDFFGESIEDVVGIVGKNGSGKTNAIELVCKILKGSKSSLPTNFILIIESEGTFTCYYLLSNLEHPTADFNIDIREYESHINPLKVVFFSNVFDDRRKDFGREVSDISINTSFYRPSIYRTDRIGDFEKQISLINSKIFAALNIEIPTKVQFTSRVWSNRFNASMERNIYGEYYERIKEFRKFFRDRVREIIPENKFIHLFRFGFFFEIVIDFLKTYKYNDERNLFADLDKFLKYLEDIKYTEEITEQLIDYLEEKIYKANPDQLDFLSSRSEPRRDNLSIEKIKSQIEFVKNIKYPIGNMKIDYNSEGARNTNLEYFTFKYETDFSKEFINEFIRLFSGNTFFEINWLGISSGHKAYLNLFSSLFHELRRTKQTNLLLCIDEGDLYLHPRWQIEFFDKLLTIMPLIYSGKTQLILTSHSPFLLSDLPNQSITILDREFPGSALNGIDLDVKTFGGNLYDLYSEPFFLGSSRTSDFAYNKIKKLIETVEGKLLLEQNKNELLKLTNLIGDEVIQFRIKKVLDNDKDSGTLK
jgi:hypothetical protein